VPLLGPFTGAAIAALMFRAFSGGTFDLTRLIN